MNTHSSKPFGGLALSTAIALFASSLVLLPSLSLHASATPLSCFAQYGIAGEGTSDLPFLIDSPAALENVPGCVTTVGVNNAVFKLTANIDATPITSKLPLGQFAGELDGNGFSITNISTTSDVANLGLFSTLSADVTLRDLDFSGHLVSANEGPVGLIAAVAEGDVSLINISLSGTIEASASEGVALGIGSVRGRLAAMGVSIENSDLWGKSFVGGLSGLAFEVEIDDASVVDVEIHVEQTGGAGFGGLIGMVQDSNTHPAVSTLSNVVVDGFKFDNSSSGAVGALIGLTYDLVDISNIFVRDITSVGDFGVGAVIGEISGGYLDVSSVSFRASGVDVASISLSVAYGSAGALVGYLRGNATVADASLVNATVFKEPGFFGAGGLFGSIEVGGASFEDIEATDVAVTSGGKSGVLAGSVDGAVTLSNVSVSNTLVSASGPAVSTLIGFHGGLLVGNEIFLASNTARSDSNSQFAAVGAVAGQSGDGISLSALVIQDSEYSGTGGLSVGVVRGGGFGYLNLHNALIRRSSVTHGDGYAGGIAGFAEGARLSQVTVDSVLVSSPGSEVGGLIGGVWGRVDMVRVVVSNVSVDQLGATHTGSAGLFGSIEELSADESLFATGAGFDLQVANFYGDASTPDDYRLSGVYGVQGLSAPELVAGAASQPVLLTPESARAPAAFQGWDFDHVWGFDCTVTSMPMLRIHSLVTAGACEQISAPPAAEAPRSEPYRGPMPTSFSSRAVALGDAVVMFGTRLHLVQAVLIDDKLISISHTTDGSLLLVVPLSMKTGLSSVVLESPAGKLTFLDAFEIVAPKSVVVGPVPTTTSETVSVSVLATRSFTGAFVRGVSGLAVSIRVGGRWQVSPAQDRAEVRIGRPLIRSGTFEVKVYVNKKLVSSQKVAVR